jgi:hypothetical protein
LTPSSLNFGSVTVGHTSVPKIVRLTNGTNKAVAIRGIAIGTDYKVLLNSCSSPLPAGKSCGYNISFEPLRAGIENEVFSVNADGFHKVSLKGTALSP